MLHQFCVIPIPTVHYGRTFLLYKKKLVQASDERKERADITDHLNKTPAREVYESEPLMIGPVFHLFNLTQVVNRAFVGG